MSARMRRAATLLATAVFAHGAVGCTAPYDNDGEAASTFRPLPAAAPASPNARSIVVDTDLGGDDLVALTYLFRHPDVRIEAITIAATGLVGCDSGPNLVADLVAAIDAPSVPVACGRAETGSGGRAMPDEWRGLASAGSGLPRSTGSAEPVPQPAHRLISSLADQHDGLTVVALGPLSNIADVAREHPDSYQRLAGVHAMAGAIDVEAVDGVAEWNAAADPEALAMVLDGTAPVTLVPDDAIPEGTPAALQASGLNTIATTTDYPKWWDLTAAAAFVLPDAATASRGSWSVDRSGRLSRSGPGPVHVLTSLDESLLEATLNSTFG